MKEDLINKLESVKLPDIELDSHRRRLKMALLHSGYSKKRGEASFLETAKAQATGTLNTISGAIVARRPVWNVALTSMLAVLVVLSIWISIPQASSVVKSTFFPEGRSEIGGLQLTADEQKKAMDILMADARITAILAEGAVVDKILPIQVQGETVDPETGNRELIRETWAQAWIVLDSKDWGVQVDLVKGKVISITE